MNQEHRQILCFDDVLLMPGSRGQARTTTPMTGTILGGELIILSLKHLNDGSAIADLCSGLIVPWRGSVRFVGRDWSTVSPDTANAMRGKIGRASSRRGWIRKMTLGDNIMIAQLHHTRRPAEAIHREAARLAIEAGLPGFPTGYPDDTVSSDLEIAGWIRAFLGSPLLVILEEPIAKWPASNREGLIQIMHRARSQGTAVIWMTQQDHLLSDTTLPATRRYRLIGWRLTEVESI